MQAIEWERMTEECVDFARGLIRTPSMPGKEGELARLIAAEMERLGFDAVWQDEIGNVLGRVNGRDRTLGALVLNCHTDHVDPGDRSLWPVSPYSAQLIDGRIHGRGACDIKGPLAVQVYGMAAVLRAGKRPRRDVVFTGVVQEEVGGAGAEHWVRNLDYPVDLVVLGEPSSNQISLGHRGVLQMWVTFHGRSVHASAPSNHENPNYALATFLYRLQENAEALSSHAILGKTTVAPTIIQVDTESMNVTPAWTRVLLDFRTASESPNSLISFVRSVAGELPHTLSDAWSDAPHGALHASNETICGYYTTPDSSVAQRVRNLVGEGMGWQPEFSSYTFATDGRHFEPHGIPVVGYSAGEERLAHTVDESISVDMMRESLRGHFNLLLHY